VAGDDRAGARGVDERGDDSAVEDAVVCGEPVGEGDPGADQAGLPVEDLDPEQPIESDVALPVLAKPLPPGFSACSVSVIVSPSR
jgi:hypothetical protein